MMKAITIVLFVAVLALPARAQVVDTNFKIVAGALVASTIFDVETTYAAIDNGAHEANPTMRPLIDAGRPAIYAVDLALDAGILYWAYTSKRDGQKWWWVLPAFLTAGHAAAGTWNLQFSVKF